MRRALHFSNWWHLSNWRHSKRRWPRRVVVAGDSMVPTLHAGDRLLVVPARRYEAGDLVAVRDPRQRDRVIVKRIDAVDSAGRQLLVTGDQPQASTDSRHFGPVSRSEVVGRVVYRYAPAGRAGRIRRTRR